MGRSLPPVVVEVVVLLLFLVPAPPLVSSAPLQKAGAGRIGSSSSRSWGTKLIAILFKAAAERGIKGHISPSGGQESNGTLDNSADTASPFILNLSVGTSSPQNIPGILDISSELVWTQCAPYNAASLLAPTFQPSMSATFARLPCGSETCRNVLNETCSAANPTDDHCRYVAIYGDDTNTTGYLAYDTFTFGDIPVPHFLFGCSDTSVVGDFFGASGVFGFSRGNLSLVSQLQLSWFSYFFASDDSGGHFELGEDNVTQSKNSRSTPLLNSSLHNDLYFVNLTGVRVDGQDLSDIPAGTFDFRADGSGGVFLSTTMPVTFFTEAAYAVVRKALASGITLQPVNGSALGLDLCYQMQSMESVKNVPELTLVFHGADAVMKLRRYNYFFKDNTTDLECLTILPTPAGSSLSLLGSLLQTGTNMTYDLAGTQLIFETAAAPPVHSPASLMMVITLAIWVLLL